MKRFIDFVKENILGLQPKTRSSPSPIREGSYAQNLLSRFNLPSARQGLAAPAGDFYGLLSAALGHAGTTGGSREVQVEEMSRSGTLIPQEIKSAAEKMTFLAAQRERLRMLLTVLDKEASDLSNEEAIEKDVERRLGEPMIEENLKKSRSEAEFEAIEKEEWTGQKNDRGSNEGGVSTWLPWSFWGAKGADKGKSSGVDTER